MENCCQLFKWRKIFVHHLKHYGVCKRKNLLKINHLRCRRAVMITFQRLFTFKKSKKALLKGGSLFFLYSASYERKPSLLFLTFSLKIFTSSANDIECQFLDQGRYYGNIISNERQIYSNFWPKHVKIFTFPQ